MSPQEFMRKWGPRAGQARTKLAGDLGAVCNYWGNCRLKRIAQILDDVDRRAMHVDGPVTPTRQEITDEEYRRIYRLAKGSDRGKGKKRHGR